MRLSSGNPLTFRCSIILVPGIGTIPPKDWPFANTDWLASLPGSGAKARVLSYEYSAPLASRKLSWESILMLGYDLLPNLSDFRSGSDLDSVGQAVVVLFVH